MAKTIQDLITNGTLKRGDQGMTCALEDFHVRPGFNTREEAERLHDSIEDDAHYTLANGISNMPQLKITPRDEGGVWIVDGHRRIRNVVRAIELGADLLHPKHKKVMLPIKPFVGDEDDQDAEIIKSQGNLKLTPLETMVALKRMADRPNAKTGELPTTSQIALKTGLKRQYVDALLVLARKVHEAVRKGEITADIASTIVRTHGDNSMAVITDELAKAKAQGKTKVTKGTMQQASLPKAVIEDVTHRVKRVVEAIPPASRDLLEQYRTEQITDGDTPVTLPVRELLALTQLSKHIDDVRDEQRTKAEKKAAKAAAQKDAEQEASEEA